MKKMISVLSLFAALAIQIAPDHARAQDEHGHNHEVPHEMQHGFILSDTDQFGSHLVATGHHSRQVEISGKLTIQDSKEKSFYQVQKAKNTPVRKTYFLFQAQHLDLPSLKAGQVLRGHIVESTVHKYEPENIIVQNAVFTVDAVHINVENPFFEDFTHTSR